jgi:ADP-ribose pyrophosphatase YjhB (NUDIX family)
MKYKYCYNCGNPTKIIRIDNVERAFCENCNLILYENPVPSVALLAKNDKDEILLVKRAVEPGFGKWSLPGGFMELGESSEQTAIRELHEETGLIGKNPRLISIDTHLNCYYGDILVIAYSVELVNYNLKPADDVSDAKFFRISERPELAFKIHEQFIEKWINKENE